MVGDITKYPISDLKIRRNLLEGMHLWCIRRLVGKRPVMLNVSIRLGEPGFVTIGDSDGLAICGCDLLLGLEYGQADRARKGSDGR